MTKSFASFVAQNPKQPQVENKKVETQTSKKNIEEMVNQFQGKSHDELLNTLHSEVEKQKANGTFNLQKLQQSIDMLSPFLNDEQKKNIKELLKDI